MCYFKNMNKTPFVLLFLLVMTSALPVFAETCPAATLCPTLAKQTISCGKWYSDTKCDPFVDTYQKLSGRYDCKRAADTKPVPAIWLCDVDATGDQPSEKSAALLAKLKNPKARDFFSSVEFRSTLEGQSAEHWFKRSQAAAKNRANK